MEESNDDTAKIVVSSSSFKQGKLTLQNPHHDPISYKEVPISLEVKQ